MKSEILEKKGCVVSFKIEIPSSEMSVLENKVLQEYMQNAPVKGFRAGKAPRDRVLRMYSGNIKKDVVSRNLGEFCTKGLEQINTKPVSEPVVNKVDYELNSALNFEGKVEIFPEFELSDYKGFDLKKHSAVVTDSDVDNYIHEMAEYSAPFETVEDRALQMGDYAITDYQIKDGEEVLEKKDGAWMKAKEGDSVLKDFIQGLIGMKIGEIKVLDTTLPENYANSKVAGKKVNVEISLKGIKTKPLPEINDEFVKKIDPKYSTLQEYKEKVRELLLKDKKWEVLNNFKNQIRLQLLKDNRLEVPPSYLKQQMDANYMEEIRMLKSRGYDDQAIKAQSEEIFKNIYEKALSQLKLQFIFGRIIENEKIEVTPEDIQKSIEEQSQEMSISKEQFNEYIKKDNKMEQFKDRILVDKMFQWIVDHAKVTEE